MRQCDNKLRNVRLRSSRRGSESCARNHRELHCDSGRTTSAAPLNIESMPMPTLPTSAPTSQHIPSPVFGFDPPTPLYGFHTR